jgi:phenylacetate-CoA ligase
MKVTINYLQVSTMSEKKFFSRIETMTREEIKKYHERNVKRRIKYAYMNSPFYKRKFDEAKIKPEDIQTLDDFYRKVPFTSKLELIENEKAKPPFGDFLAVDRAKVRRIYLYPGPIYEPYTKLDIRKSAEIVAKCMYTAGVRGEDTAIITFSYHFVSAGPLFGDGAAHLGCTVIGSGVGQTKLQVEAIQTLRVTTYIGTPSFLAQIGVATKEAGIDPKTGLQIRKAICGAEPLPPTLRNELQETFGCKVFNVYGIAELGLISRECPELSGMHINEDYYILEIVDPKTGERLGPGEEGEVVITPLWREALPLIRYRTGDASVYEDKPCACGRTEVRLLRIMGRVDTLTKVKGMFIHPKQAEMVISKFPELGRFQIIVERPETLDVMTVKIECSETAQNLDELRQKLAQSLKEALRVEPVVQLVKKGEIPADAKVVEDKRQY